MKIVCTVCGTTSYMDAIEPCLRRIQASVFHARAKKDFEFELVISTDKESEAYCKNIAPEAHVIALKMKEGGKAYKEESQILIANLQQVGFQKAIELGADLCWTVESDILVPYNALSCMMTMLEFDDGYYDVSFCTYPSQSGGGYLGGHGTPSKPIEDDFLPEERELPPELSKRIEDIEKRIKEADPNDIALREDIAKEHAEIREKIKECPPKGNVFELNGKRWRKRGWLDSAYPAIGKGAVLETDWTGLGCNLLSRRALALASFDGYDGRGTQDLFLNWKRWKANGLRFCVITHAVCEHLVRSNVDGSRVNAFAHHEQQGECKGHLRVQHLPFYLFNGKDIFVEGKNSTIKPRKD